MSQFLTQPGFKKLRQRQREEGKKEGTYGCRKGGKEKRERQRQTKKLGVQAKEDFSSKRK